MARANTAAEIWDSLSQFGIMVDSTSGVSTTLAGGLAASSGSTGDAAAPLTTGTYVRIGAYGEASVAKVEATTSSAFTLVSQIKEVKSTGDAIVQLVRTDLGDISDDGITIDSPTDRTRIDVATQLHRYRWLLAHTDFSVSVALSNLSPENLLTAKGIGDGSVHGAGTAADPSISDWDPADFNGITPFHFWAQGTLGDGTTVEVQFWDCDMDPTGAMQLARGSAAPVPLTFNPRFIRWINPVS